MKFLKQLISSFKKETNLDNESTFYDNNWENIENVVFNNNYDTWKSQEIIVCTD